MAIYGHEGITEAKQIKGQEYDRLTQTDATGRQVVVLDPVDGQRYATNSTGRGGVLDSVAQNHIQDLDLEKEKQILESKDILNEYTLYISGQIEKAISQYADQSKSQLEKRMVEELSVLEQFITDPQKRIKLITDEYYGGKYIDDLNEEDTIKVIKTVLKLRINYVNKITSLMSKMLKTNYKVLGLSEEQAKTYIDSLSSGKNDAVKAAGDILKLIKSNGDKFLTNNGQSVDLRQLGFGVILGPSKGYELGLSGTDFTNKDAMLNLVQSAMRYDVVVVAHGIDDGDMDDENSKSIMKDLRKADLSYHDDQEKIIDKMESLSKEDRQDVNQFINIYKSAVSVLVKDGITEYIDDELTKIVESKSGDKSGPIKKLVHDVIERFYDSTGIREYVKNAYKNSNYGEDVINQVLNVYDKFKKEYIEPMTKITFAENIFNVIKIELLESLDGEIELYWGCQPTRTLKAGPFDDVNDLVRQLIKEGYKKILIKDCNPAGHKLAKDIMNTKGIIINYSNFSNYVESTTVDDDLLIFNETETALREFAESYGIDYDNDEYLTECVDWYINNYELINEGEGAFDSLKEFFKKILTGIVGFFKNIFTFIKRAYHALKSLFTGNKENPKDKETKFQKPIKTKMIDIADKKVVEIVCNNREELDKQASSMCTKLISEIKKFNSIQQNSLKKIEGEIDGLAKKQQSQVSKESCIFNPDDFLLEGMDLLDSVNLFMEFDAPGAEPDEEEEDEDFSMDDEGGEGETEDTPAPAAETPETTNAEPAEASADAEDEDFSMGDEGETETPAEETPETPAETPEDEGEDENFDIPDDAGEEGGEGAPEGDAEDEDFSMGDEGGEAGDTDAGMEGEAPVDDTSSEPEEMSETEAKLRDLESVIFDDLNEEEKKLKIKELKELYVLVYKKCGTITDMLTDIKKDEETIQIIEYISNTLIDLKQYVDDYINQVFDSKTYIENLSQLQKYIMIFNAINKVFDQIKKENDE